jgi:lipoate-protein ligase A
MVIRWRLLLTGARPGDWNMACDSALLAAVGGGLAPATVRFYAWAPPAVSLGHHQSAPGPPAAAVLAARGVAWVRRPTGGRTVYHGPASEELTYSVVAPIGVSPLTGGLADAYRRIHTALAAGLRRLGVPVELAPRTTPRSPGSDRPAVVGPTSRLACFAASVPYEITAGGRKLLGSAQRRGRRAFLQHGSLPLAGEQEILDEAWPGSLEADCWTTLAAAAGRKLDFDRVAAALMEGFAETLNVSLAPGVLTDSESARIAALCDGRPGGGAPVATRHLRDA